MFYFQMALCFEIELMYKGVQKERKTLLHVSNADILFIDTFLQLICENFGGTSSCVWTKKLQILKVEN